MNSAWMDVQFAGDVYQAFLILLVWVPAPFICFGVLAPVILLVVECEFRSAHLASRPENEMGGHGRMRAARPRLVLFTELPQCRLAWAE